MMQNLFLANFCVLVKNFSDTCTNDALKRTVVGKMKKLETTIIPF